MIPVDREALGRPTSTATTACSSICACDSAPDPAQDAAVEALERAGQPVVRIAVDDPYDIGEEFFRWEIATAVAGSIIGIHPFDQPDVEASKIATRKLTTEYEKSGRCPAETPIFKRPGSGSSRTRRMRRRWERAGTERHWRGTSGPSRSNQGRRLLRPSGLHRNERRARTTASGDPTCCAR